MTRSKRIIVVGTILVVLIGLDHLTKWIAIEHLKDSGVVYRFVGDLFRLQYAENTGAFLSLGSGLPDGVRALIMTGLNAVILGALLIYMFVKHHIGTLPLCAFSLVAAGGIGNLIDRIFRDGRVVDFMNMGITYGQFSLRTGIFNVADIAIMAGLFLVILNEIYHMMQERQSLKGTPDKGEKKRRS